MCYKFVRSRSAEISSKSVEIYSLEMHHNLAIKTFYLAAERTVVGRSFHTLAVGTDKLVSYYAHLTCSENLQAF